MRLIGVLLLGLAAVACAPLAVQTPTPTVPNLSDSETASVTVTLRRTPTVAAPVATVAATAPAAVAKAAELPAGVLRLTRADGRSVDVRIEVAADEASRQRGLMFRESMAEDAGMLFVFQGETDGPFWMKDTLIPLSIAFVDEEGIVVGVLDMEPCGSDSCPNYGIERPYVLAIEANLGWFDEHGIGAGDRAKLKVSAYG